MVFICPRLFTYLFELHFNLPCQFNASFVDLFYSNYIRLSKKQKAGIRLDKSYWTSKCNEWLLPARTRTSVARNRLKPTILYKLIATRTQSSNNCHKKYVAREDGLFFLPSPPLIQFWIFKGWSVTSFVWINIDGWGRGRRRAKGIGQRREIVTVAQGLLNMILPWVLTICQKRSAGSRQTDPALQRSPLWS